MQEDLTKQSARLDRRALLGYTKDSKRGLVLFAVGLPFGYLVLSNRTGRVRAVTSSHLRFYRYDDETAGRDAAGIPTLKNKR